MRHILLLASGIVVMATAMAQVPSVLIEACNAIADPSKRLECLNAAMGQTKTSAPSYDAVRRSFTGLQSGLSIGMSYNNYQAGLLEAARELAIYEQSAPPAAKDGIAQLNAALETYRDCGTFWEAAIRFYARRDNGVSYFGGLPVAQVGLEWMVPKHGLPTRNADLLGLFVGVPTDLGRQRMWAKAANEADDGFRLLRDGPKPPPPPVAPDPALSSTSLPAPESNPNCHWATPDKYVCS